MKIMSEHEESIRNCRNPFVSGESSSDKRFQSDG